MIESLIIMHRELNFMSVNFGEFVWFKKNFNLYCGTRHYTEIISERLLGSKQQMYLMNISLFSSSCCAGLLETDKIGRLFLGSSPTICCKQFVMMDNVSVLKFLNMGFQGSNYHSSSFVVASSMLCYF